MHGSIAATNAILGLRRTVDTTGEPRVTFTDPEIAVVGIDPRTARRITGLRVQTLSHSHLDRAIAETDTGGLTQLVLDRKHRIVGASIWPIARLRSDHGESSCKSQRAAEVESVCVVTGIGAFCAVTSAAIAASRTARISAQKPGTRRRRRATRRLRHDGAARSLRSEVGDRGAHIPRHTSPAAQLAALLTMLRNPTMTRAGRQFARGVKTEAQIAKMGLTLPSLPQPAGAYQLAVKQGSFVTTAGHLPFKEDMKTPIPGIVGKDFTTAQGAELAKLTALELVSSLKVAVGVDYTSKDVEELIALADTDGTGAVELDEFKAICRGQV